VQPLPPFAFVDLNTQEDYFGPSSPLKLPNAAVARKNIALLMAQLQRLRLPLLAGCDAHGAQDPEFQADGLPPHALAGTPGAARIFETRVRGAFCIPVSGKRRPWPDLKKIIQEGGQLVLEKNRFDLFSNPACREVLRPFNVRELVLWGAMLEHDILATALTARALGWEVTLVHDAAAFRSQAGEVKARHDLGVRGARLALTEEVILRLDWWQRKQVRQTRRIRAGT
jgi:nicotinamidase-related amidase